MHEFDRLGYLDKVMDIIDKHGWAVQAVFGDSDTVGYSYTVGFKKTFDHPEIVMQGFPPDLCQTLMNDVGAMIDKGANFSVPLLVSEIISNYDVAFRPLTDDAMLEHGGVARAVYGGTVPAVQMFLPDAKGKFPWEPGCDPKYASLQTGKFDVEGPEPTTHIGLPSRRN